MPRATEAFFSLLHREHLKPLGFRKTRHTFSRARDGYVERYQFQGSAWNEGSGPWRFYINVGVAFDDLPPREPARDFPGTHRSTRIEDLVAGAPSEFDLPGGDTTGFACEIARLVLAGAECLAVRWRDARRKYESEGWSPLSLA